MDLLQVRQLTRTGDGPVGTWTVPSEPYAADVRRSAAMCNREDGRDVTDSNESRRAQPIGVFSPSRRETIRRASEMGTRITRSTRRASTRAAISCSRCASATGPGCSPWTQTYNRQNRTPCRDPKTIRALHF